MSMLPGAPWLLAHKSMLQVNKPRKVSLYGCDYVLWKDITGNLSALPLVVQKSHEKVARGGLSLN